MLKSKTSRWLAGPYLVWMAAFIVVPLFIVIWYALTNADGQFTLENLTQIGRYSSVFARSLILAAVSTVICLILAFPVGYFLSRLRANKQHIMLMLVMLPMWMNFLLRTYSWMFLLERNGFINNILGSLGFFNLLNGLNGALNGAFGLALPTDVAYIEFLGTQGAVVLGMVYNFLPFMILPIFSVIEKIDPRVIEAAQDLGANSQQVFRKVIFPLSLPGVLSGVTMVFIPSVSTFVISRLLGGGTTILLGDLIEMQFLGNAYNPHLGSAISLVMMVIVLVCMGIMNRFGEGEGEAVLL